MFLFLKSKPKLKDLITDNYVDIHSHLLPGIDDGSKDFDQTKLLISRMESIGFKQFITTPHVIKNVWNNSKIDIQNLETKTNNDLKNLNSNTTIRAAAEYMMDIDFIELFKSEKLLTIKDNYVLVEMSYVNAPLQLYEIIFDLQIAGYIPVLAHPERYSFYENNFNEYKRLKKAGCKFQLNLLSTVGYYGPEALKIANKLLENNMIDFVGSDIHHENHINSFDLKVKVNNYKLLERVIDKNKIFSF
ncbi:MAG: histidinol phosphatase [Flavobacterium sp.]|nr:histidinol phosphatase [Flavobacterium sp.]